MAHCKRRNEDMYIEEWYNKYLMSYVDIIYKPKFTQEQRIKYNEIRFKLV